MERLGTFAKTSQPLATRRPSDREINCCSPEKAAERASILIGCYRTGDAADPEVYATALVAMLTTYPEDIVVRVTDPRTGLPGQSKWLPTIFEVRHACEVELQPARDAQRRQREREEAERIIAERGAARMQRGTFSDLRQRYPDVIGMSGHKTPLTEAEKAKIYADLVARKAELRAPLPPSDLIRQTFANPDIESNPDREGDEA